MLNDDGTKSSLRDLRGKIEVIRSVEVLKHDFWERWGRVLYGPFFYEMDSSHGIPLVILAVLNAAILGPNPTTPLVYLGTWLLRKLLGYDEPGFMGRWRKRAKAIEDQFPQLVGLVNY